MGFDINLNARFGDGGILITGFSAGKVVKNDCEQENPNGNLHGVLGLELFSFGGPWCDQTPFDIPFDKTFKLSGAYPLPVPGDIQVSGVFQSVPGNIRTITGVALGFQIPGATFSSALLPFSQPGEEFTDRHNQLDLKFNGTIRSGNVRIQPEFAIYNALNADTILLRNNVYTPFTADGGTLNNIQAIVDGRVMRVGVNITF